MINLQISNQQPLDLTKFFPKITDLQTDFKTNLENTVSKPLSKLLLTPLTKSNPTNITLNQKQLTQKDLIQMMNKSIASDNLQAHLNDSLSVIFHQASRYKAPRPQNWLKAIATSQLIKNKMQLPTPNSIYTYISDVQIPAKDLIASDTLKHRQNLILNLVATLLPKPISNRWTFILVNQASYQAFKNNLNHLIQTTTQDPIINKNNQDAQKLNLDTVFTSWVTGKNNDQLSFNRFIQIAISQTMSQTKQVFSILPINLQALVNPVGFSFIGLENLADTDNQDFNQELINLQGITNRLIRFRITKLSKIQTAQTIQQHTQNPSNKKHYIKHLSQANIKRRRQQGFHRTLPSAQLQIKRLINIVNHHISKTMSENTYQQFHTTFMRPNRRHPNDPNLRGRIQTTKYRPDIHIFLDTSGSISEPQYKTGVTLLIQVAKRLNTNLFFTSFSDQVTQPVKLATRNASVKQIYQQIQAIPKQFGGTEYENVWNLIDLLNKFNHKFHHADQLNFIITDFAYDVRSSWTPRVHQPSTTKTYYLPLAANQNDYNNCRSWGMDFANELIDLGDFNIKNRILM